MYLLSEYGIASSPLQRALRRCLGMRKRGFIIHASLWPTRPSTGSLRLTQGRSHYVSITLTEIRRGCLGLVSVRKPNTKHKTIATFIIFNFAMLGRLNRWNFNIDSSKSGSSGACSAVALQREVAQPSVTFSRPVSFRLSWNLVRAHVCPYTPAKRS